MVTGMVGSKRIWGTDGMGKGKRSFQYKKKLLIEFELTEKELCMMWKHELIYNGVDTMQADQPLGQRRQQQEPGQLQVGNHSTEA